MIETFQKLIKKYFSHEEAVIFIFIAAATVALFYFLGAVLMPVFMALVFAYLLIPSVDFLNRRKVPYFISVCLVFTVFMSFLAIVAFWLIPKFFSQLTKFISEIPVMVTSLKNQLISLQANFPEYFSTEQLNEIILRLNGSELSQQAGQIIPQVLSFSLSTLPSVMTGVIYLVIVPILVFFMLKDKNTLLNNFKKTLPTRRNLLRRISSEMNQQIENYIRGKAIEIAVVFGVSFVVFEFFGLDYAFVLSIFVGLSVLIPYIGAVIVTIPIAVVALIQFNLSSEFYWVIGAYMVIQILDGNVLVPIIFSEAVNLHPIAIIIAVLVFGGVWGFWGVFFAIPLATLVKAIFNAWPKQNGVIDSI
ncbi:AI-2E family transporter [Marinicellulosiphila megalodicopiae]|uniref:AI-2E family transporter n=1 Tax=Marinicellulosiphila megalodicopiae TaxID=2724896 RepID=UPI003BAE9BC6